ncbi:MAG: hypothetical protein HYX61_07330 [Gammaproteobacteria bacterium]|jgi:hypothetical protein|nr:hypothetical protein [Gammaproteobacteria bacterium]
MLNFNNNLQEFLSRLKNVKNNNHYPNALLECISPKDLNQILDKLIFNKELHKQLQSLPVSNALHLPKEISKLSRTIAIARDPEGQYLCILETKSKNAKNEKCEIEELDGGFKSGKPAWRLDGLHGPTPYASLSVEIETKKRKGMNLTPLQQIEKLKKEIAYPWQVPENDFLLRSVQGPIYTNKKGIRFCIYSPLGIPLIDRKKYGLKLSQEDKNDIASQLLQGLCFMHELGDIHQDIKPGNVIIFIDENRKKHAKYIDFASICGREAFHRLLSTIGYESPEIALAHTNKKMPDYTDYVRAYKTEKTLAKKYADEIEKRFLEGNQKRELDALKKEYENPAFENDVWACGIMLYELYHQNFTPMTPPKEEFFKGMLNPKRNKRLTAKQALSLFNNTYCPQASKTFLPHFQSKMAQAQTKSLLTLVQEKVKDAYQTLHHWIDGARSLFTYATTENIQEKAEKPSSKVRKHRK